MKDFEDLPQQISYIAWNLKRIADEFKRYNDAQNYAPAQEETKKPSVWDKKANLDKSSLRKFINDLGKDDTAD